MKKLTGILILIALIVLIVIQLKGNKEISENRVYHYDKEQEIIVHTAEVKLAFSAGSHSFSGAFEAYKEVKVNTDVPGKIVRMYVDEGTPVKKGQNLIKLDDQLLKLKLQSAEAQIEGLEADVARYTVLSDAGAIQGVKLEKALLGLKSAKIQQQTLLETISKTTIKAPFNGVVTMKMSEVGAFAAPGIPLLLLTDISQLKFIINVSESNLSLFKMNESYSIKADLFSDLELRSEVTMIGSKGNMGNSFPVQFQVENTSENSIKSKMFGEVSVTLSGEGKSILIPSSAIIGSTIQPQVYLVKGGKAVLQKVSISRRIGNKAVIENGVKEGDVIITSGFINLYDGANVVNSKN
jgi:membrane fusion protein (multidrug efflux system)